MKKQQRRTKLRQEDDEEEVEEKEKRDSSKFSMDWIKFFILSTIYCKLIFNDKK